MDRAAVAHVRSFNRAVAERIGALGDGFLGRGRPMGESRTLWEIGDHGAEVRELRARLGLDSGYVSRVLRSLERQGFVKVEPSRRDRRVRFARLTRRGRAERAELDRRSDAIAWSFLEPLDESRRAKLVALMDEVERLLRASQVRLGLEDPTTPDARYCIDRYFAELNARFENGFDASRTNPFELHELVPPAGLLVMGRLHGQPVACGALKFHSHSTAELKRMWVSPEVRGLGVGGRLLRELERLAARGGAWVVRLETNRALQEAIQLYHRDGYSEVPAFNTEPYAHHWFEKKLTSVTPGGDG